MTCGFFPRAREPPACVACDAMPKAPVPQTREHPRAPKVQAHGIKKQDDKIHVCMHLTKRTCKDELRSRPPAATLPGPAGGYGMTTMGE